MQANSRGASACASPPLPEVTRASKNVTRLSTRRGSATSWLIPHTTNETLVSQDGKVAAALHDSVQADDYRMITSDSSSILSGVETVAPQSHRSSSEHSTRRGPYGVLTGFLSRRAPEAKSRKSDASGGKQRGPSPSLASPQGTAKPSSRGSHNPLLEGYAGVGGGASTGGTHIGAGGYDWPTPPSPIKDAETLLPLANNSRHESTGSPMLSLQSHSTPAGTTGRAECRDRRSGSRFAGHGESHFVPLGSIELGNRGGSASMRRPEAEETHTDSALSTSTVTGRASVVGRRKVFGHVGPAAGSLSRSQSQSNEQLTHTRGSQMRTLGTDEIDYSGPSSSSNMKSMRDAKAALLRHAHGAGASIRTSRAQSFRRVPSNVGGADPAGLPTHRSIKMRAVSRERRSMNASGNGAGRDDGESLCSISPEDDAVRTSFSPSTMGSPMLSRPGVLFPATAVNQEGDVTMSHVGTSRRFSRTEEGSGAFLEVMETSALTSRGNVNTGSNTAGSSGQTTRGRSAGSFARSTPLRLGASTSRGDAPHLPSISNPFNSMQSRSRNVLSGVYSLSRTGGYGDSGGSEDGTDMEERHRHKVDEVLRRLNRPQRSITGNNHSVMSRVAASETGGNRNEVVAILNTDGPSGEGGGSSCAASVNNNSAAVGWSGVGGPGWGGLAGFGAGAADSSNDGSAAVSTGGTGNGDGGGGGGWAGLGGDAGSDDWYARMRKKAEEEELAEAEAAAAATVAGTDVAPNGSNSSPEAATKAASPGTVSFTVRPGLAVTSSPSSGVAETLPSTSEAPMPSIARGAGSRGPSSLASLRSRGSRLSSTPNSSVGPAPSTLFVPLRPSTSARTPVKPSPPPSAAVNGATDVSALVRGSLRRPAGAASRPTPLENVMATMTGASPLEPPIEDLEGTPAPATSVLTGRTKAYVSTPSGHQLTLPGATTTTAASPTRHALRSSALLAAAASPNVEAAASSHDVENLAQFSKARDNSRGTSRETRDVANDAAGSKLPGLLPQRAETSTPVSSNASSGAATPGHRRFSFRRRGSLPRVLPVSTSGSTASPSAGGTASTATALNFPASAQAMRNGRMSLISSSSIDTFGKGSTQPASPSGSVSQNTRGASRLPSVTATAEGSNASTTTDTPLGTRRNSSSNKRGSAPFTAALRGGPTGPSRPSFSPGLTPKRPEVPATKSRAVAASTRFSFS